MFIVQRGAMAKKKQTHPAVMQADPTPERLLKAGADIELGDDKHGRRVMTVRDAPIERALVRNDITPTQYRAAQKYRHHWYHAGLAGSLQSLDVNRVFGSEGCYGMAKTEAQAHHRRQFRNANDEVGTVGIAVLDHVVCRELPLADFGFAVGWKSESKAINASRETLKATLTKLVRHWGLS